MTETLEVPLRNGGVALVDREDYERVSLWPWRWEARGKFNYAVARVRDCHGKVKKVYMHRFILSPPDALVIDHRNQNGLDNRRGNIRACTRADNRKNAAPRPSRVPFKGVYANHGKWSAKIVVNGKQIYLGAFVTQLEAARAYDAAALRLYGEFARPNFPERSE